MTLVVARKKENRIAIVSDTLISEHGAPLSRQRGMLKTILLPGGLAVSYSNSPELALTEFRNFLSKYPTGTNLENSILFFELSSDRTGNEYIVSCSNSLENIKIRNGKRTNSSSRTQWIGDAEAFDSFRKYEADILKKHENGRAFNGVVFADEAKNSPASELYSTFRHVIFDRKLSNVGGFPYVLSSRGIHFRQSVYSDMLFNWPVSENDNFKLTLNQKIDFGVSGENLNCASCQFSPSYLGLNIVAFYLLKGNIIYIFIGGAEKSLVFEGIHPKLLSILLKSIYKKDLKWLLMVLSAAEEAKETRFRTNILEDENFGVKIHLYCHANTFPPTKQSPDQAFS